MLSGASAFVRHTRAREHLWPLRDHWADTGHRVRCYGGRSAPTPSLVCHFVLDEPLRMTLVLWRPMPPADAKIPTTLSAPPTQSSSTSAYSDIQGSSIQSGIGIQ